MHPTAGRVGGVDCETRNSTGCLLVLLPPLPLRLPLLRPLLLPLFLLLLSLLLLLLLLPRGKRLLP